MSSHLQVLRNRGFVGEVNAETYKRVVCSMGLISTLHHELVNSALGMAGESGELAEAIYNNHSSLDRLSEIGDCWWYSTRAAHLLDIEISGVALSQYPVYESTEHAIRALYKNAGVVCEMTKKIFIHGRPKSELTPILVKAVKAYWGALATINPNLSEVWTYNLSKLVGRYDYQFNSDGYITNPKPAK